MQSEVNIWSLVKSLLHRNNCVIVPNLGGFLAHQQSATIDPLSMLITPPCKHITFNAQLTLNDGLLATKIADYLKISYSDAIKIIDEEVSNFHQTLKNNSQFVIDGLGNFELNENQNLVFSPDKKANFLINSFGLEAVRINSAVGSKTTKIIPKVDLITNISAPEIADLNSTDEETESANVPVQIGKRRRNSLVFSLIGSVLFLVLGLNAYIFLQEGNLTPIRNKFNELDLGVKVQSVIALFSNNESVVSNQNKEDILKNYNPTNETKDADFKTELFEKNNTVEPSAISLDALQVIDNQSNTEIANNEPIEEVSVSEVNASYYIIAGAFKNETKAKKLLKELNADGFPNAEIIENPKASSKKLKFFVTYNKFSSLNETTLELGKINENENPDAWIFEVK
jgi:hypothetical protein